MSNFELRKLYCALLSIEVFILVMWTILPNERPKFGWVCEITEDRDQMTLFCDGGIDEFVDPRKTCIPGAYIDGYTPVDVKPPILRSTGADTILVTELVVQGQCTTSLSLLLLQTTYMAVLLLWGVVLAYRTIHIPKDFNESRWIAICIYNFAVFGPLVGIVQSIIDQNPNAIALLRGVGLLIGVGTVWALFHGTKVFFFFHFISSLISFS